MERTIIDFVKKNTTEKNFYCSDNKKLFNIDNVNIKGILISKGLFPALNHDCYVIGYEHNQKIRPLYIKLPKNVCTGKTFKKNIIISFEINDSYFFEKWNKIWKEFKELMGINFETKPPFSNNITCTTKIKTLLPYSVDYSVHKTPKKINHL